MRKVELLPTRDCEAGCGPAYDNTNGQFTYVVLGGGATHRRIRSPTVHVITHVERSFLTGS